MIDLPSLVNSAKSVPKEDQPRVIDFAEAPNLFVKSILLPKAQSIVPQHSHKSGHLTMLAIGEMFVWKDGKFLGLFKAPASIYIPSEVKHTFMTIVDGCLLYCIHKLNDGEQEPGVLDEHQL